MAILKFQNNYLGKSFVIKLGFHFHSHQPVIICLFVVKFVKLSKKEMKEKELNF
jgi:hypothetical protein